MSEQPKFSLKFFCSHHAQKSSVSYAFPENGCLIDFSSLLDFKLNSLKLQVRVEFVINYFNCHSFKGGQTSLH